jgi:hypothetical protein
LAARRRRSYDKGVLQISMPVPKELAPKKVSVQIESKK